MDKTEIRKQILEKREVLTDRETKSRRIVDTLEKLDRFEKADRLLLYHSHGSEVVTDGLLEKWRQKKNLYLPRLTRDSNFVALAYDDPGQLKEGIFGIPEPQGTPEADHLDLIIVPGLAFDRQGVRLGMGKGYYDRFLKRYPGVFRIGLAFKEQILDRLPKEPYDENVDLIITDEEIIDPKS